MPGLRAALRASEPLGGADDAERQAHQCPEAEREDQVQDMVQSTADR
jgi:hypothetical protein